MTAPQSKSEVLKSHQLELTKDYATYDANDRMQYHYSAKADAATGDACIKTTYTYILTSARIEKRQEEYTTWDSSYDI